MDYKEYLELVYIFANHASLCKVKITLKVDPAKPVAPTLSAVFDCASWYEREIREFYGVLFEGHPNMTYLFLHEGIDFYPLRKEQVPVTDEDKRALGAFKPEAGEDTFSINLGPQHPSTHGVLQGRPEDGRRVHRGCAAGPRLPPPHAREDGGKPRICPVSTPTRAGWTTWAPWPSTSAM